MNIDKLIETKQESIRQCQGAVWDCDNADYIIIEHNSYKPSIHGDKKATPFCSKCGRCGVARNLDKVADLSQYENTTRNAVNAMKKDHEIYKKNVKKDLESLYVQRVEKEDARRREANALWWSEYNAYLKSPEWQKKRLLVIKRDKECQSCLSAPATQVHHLTYKHVYKEPLFELVGVCKTCHDQITQMDRESFTL